MMKVKAPRIHIPRPKKAVVIITISAIIVAALGVYGYFSYATWRDLDTESKQVSSSLKTAVNEALGGENETISPTTEMKKLISDFDKKYSESPCQVSSLYSWQMSIPQVKTIANECDERFLDALAFMSSLKLMLAFTEHEQKASTLLTAAIDATKTPTDYTAASAAWKVAADAAELTDTGIFQSVADKIKGVATAISGQYTSLATAIKDEDKATFDTAVKNLQAAYGSTEEIKTLTASERQKLVLTVADAYDKL